MSGKNKNTPTLPNSPYMPLRKDRPVKVDVHPPTAVAASDFPSSLRRNKEGKKDNVWIKPKSNAVQVPPEVLEVLTQDIEKRHAGTTQAEEIVFYQDPRPFIESIRKSWAAGLSLMLLIVSVFLCIGIVVYVPSYLIGTALLPPVIAIIVTALLVKRIRVDLAGCYALTKNRAIVVVPKTHLGIFKPLVLSYDFLVEKNLIMVQMHEERLQDKILSREPILADIAHSPHSVATVSFYPRTKFSIPLRFLNVQNSHAFELDFTSVMLNSPAPVNGGQLKVEKPDFAHQQAASKRFKIWPILGAVWFLLIIGTISALLWGVYYTQTVKTPLSIAMVVLSWLFAVTLSIASFYPVYALSRQKREAIANGRYAKYVISK